MPFLSDPYQPYSEAEDSAFWSFIEGTNVAGDLEGYKRMVARVGDMLGNDHGISLKRLLEMIEEDSGRQQNSGG